MTDMLKRIFAKSATEGDIKKSGGHAHDVRVAVCALCVEMGRIDNSFTQQELESIITILMKKYNLSKAHADALIQESDQELERSVDLWQFAKAINDNYSVDEKMEILDMLWRIVFVDGKMDEHEHYLMNKLSKLLRLTHQQLIDAKLKVLHTDRKGRHHT